MKYLLKIQSVGLMGLLLVIGSCKDFVEINEDPNNSPSPVLELLLPATQVSLAGSVRNINQGTSSLVQHLFAGSTGRNLQDGTTYQQSWNSLYAQVLNDTEIIIAEGTRQQQWGYVAIAKLQKAYIYSLMVDLWGDIPYRQASQGLAVPDPVFENGKDIYDQLFVLIDEGLADADRGVFSILPVGADIIYRGNKSAWIRMANTLKLKLFNQIRLVEPNRARDGIAALLAAGAPLISTNAQDFSFRFGATETPANRHPWHRSEYVLTKDYYVSQGFVDRLFKGDDPRLRYYFYRQNGTAITGNGNTGNGYYGRYTGDPTGEPNDAARRATLGVYPAGGLYDNNPINNLPATNVFVTNAGTNATFVARAVTNTDGTGAGVLPMITNFMTKFILAEAALTLGTPGDTSQLFREGITAHLNSVNTIATTSGNAAPPIPAATITAFVGKLANEFKEATPAGKLALVMTQKYIALYGNGMESYTDYRRTGLPVLRTPEAPLNTFPLRLSYSVTELATNVNVSERADQVQTAQQTTPVFWDIN